MAALNRALFPIDLSLNYQKLSDTTRRMFDRPDTEIVMLHAIEEPSRSVRGLEVARSMAQMEFLARKEFAFAQVSRRVERGRAAGVILEYAQSHQLDVIVMPPGGQQGFGRGSQGHVAEEVMLAAPCAVWTERMTVETPCAEAGIRDVCCAVGLDGSDESVLRRAAEIAAQFGAELTIVHAVAPESPMALWWDVDALEQELRIARLRSDELRDKFAPGARLHVEGGRSEWVVGRALRRLGAGLLVAAGRDTVSLVGAATCPVLRVASPSPKAVRSSRPDGARTLAATA